MAEFISQKENARRMIILFAFVLLDVIALGFGIFAMKKASDIESGEKEVNTIITAQAEVKKLEIENLAIRNNVIAFSQPIGWREHATWSIDRIPTGAMNSRQLKSFLNRWAIRLKPTKPGAGEPESIKFHLLKGIEDLTRYTSAGEKANESDGASANEFTERLKEIAEKVSRKDFAPWGEDSSKVGLTLENLFIELETLRAAYTSLSLAIEKRTKAIGGVETKIVAEAKEGLDKDMKGLDKTIGDLIGTGRSERQPEDLVRPGGLLEELNQAESAAPVQIAKKRKELAVVQGQLEKQRHTNKSFRVEMEGRMKDLKTRISWMKFRKEEARERQDPDGEILAVVPDQQIAYIDLLQKDHLFRGMVFDVYSLQQGGLKIKKGRVEVIQVREDGSSVVAITKLSDASDPIKTGDRIFNEAFEKGIKRYIAFAGTMRQRLSNEELSSMIRQAGDEFQRRVDEKTSFVVVGDGYDRDANFEKARELGVRLILERSLLRYLGVK